MTALATRLVSAAILLPATIAAVLIGHPVFDLFVAAFCAAVIWEWISVSFQAGTSRSTVQHSPAEPSHRTSVASVASAIGGLSVLIWGLGGLGWLEGAVVVSGAAILVFAISRLCQPGLGVWPFLGVLYGTLPALALLSLRGMPENGQALVLWVIAIAVLADTLAYAAGKTIGGPKLAPRISPNKTWAGLGGAVLGAGLAGLLAAPWLGSGELWKLSALSAALGLVEQAGDLVESWFKRHFGVKDSGRIIPGHGGVLDRVDGLLAVALAVAAIVHIWGAPFQHAND